MEIIRRVQAAQAVIDRFYQTPFEWGSNDCAHLCALAMVRLGHDDPMFGIGGYATPRAAYKALKRLGHADLEALLDARFERIAPAAALPGDIVGLPGEGDRTALGIAIGQDRILAFANGIGDWGPTHVCTSAWRVEPKAVA